MTMKRVAGANLDEDERWAAQSAADCKPALHHLVGHY